MGLALFIAHEVSAGQGGHLTTEEEKSKESVVDVDYFLSPSMMSTDERLPETRRSEASVAEFQQIDPVIVREGTTGTIPRASELPMRGFGPSSTPRAHNSDQSADLVWNGPQEETILPHAEDMTRSPRVSEPPAPGFGSTPQGTSSHGPLGRKERKISEEDFLSDQDMELILKLAEFFEPTLVRRAMKENPGIRAVTALANLIYDNYSQELASG